MVGPAAKSTGPLCGEGEDAIQLAGLLIDQVIERVVEGEVVAVAEVRLVRYGAAAVPEIGVFAGA